MTRHPLTWRPLQPCILGHPLVAGSCCPRSLDVSPRVLSQGVCPFDFINYDLAATNTTHFKAAPRPSSYRKWMFKAVKKTEQRCTSESHVQNTSSRRLISRRENRVTLLISQTFHCSLIICGLAADLDKRMYIITMNLEYIRDTLGFLTNFSVIYFIVSVTNIICYTSLGQFTISCV